MRDLVRNKLHCRAEPYLLFPMLVGTLAGEISSQQTAIAFSRLQPIMSTLEHEILCAEVEKEQLEKYIRELEVCIRWCHVALLITECIACLARGDDVRARIR